METEPSKPKNRTKRKERAHQLNQEKQNLVDEGFSGDEGEGSPPRSSKEKNRSKPRRQRNNSSHSFEEDVIDGFAIMSFKTLEDLEVSSIDQLLVCQRGLLCSARPLARFSFSFVSCRDKGLLLTISLFFNVVSG